MKNRFLCLLTLIMLCTYASAVSLVVWTADGKQTEYKLGDKAILGFSPKEIIITTESSEIHFSKNNYLRFEVLPSEEDGIDDVNSNEQIDLTDKELTSKGLAPNSVVAIYATNGTCIQKARTDAQGSINLALEGLPHGVYVVKTPTDSFKIIKK